jgi:hypothetical protein
MALRALLANVRFLTLSPGFLLKTSTLPTFFPLCLSDDNSLNHSESHLPPEGFLTFFLLGRRTTYFV